jgi:hypothetical protein
LLACALLGFAVWTSAAAASRHSAAEKAQTRYAKVRRVCRLPRPGHAGCMALKLSAARAGTPGALAYVLAAGATSKGPAGGLTPADLASAYAFSPTATGAGQTVAIVDAYDDPKIEKDLAMFDTNYGLPACTTGNGCFTKVGQTGSSSALPAPDTSGWSVEMALDVETVRSVCQNCKILLVEANSEDNADLAAATDEAVALGAGVVSNSYGSPEGEEEEAKVAAAYDHPGVVIVASSGDAGYYDWEEVEEFAPAPERPDAPAVYPTVVSAGGTSLKLSGRGLRKSETVWNDSGQPSNGVFRKAKQFAATGGGCSTLFTAPTWQQQAAGWAASGCGTHRLSSDVSAVADPYTGFDIYSSYKFEALAETGWITIGGTSLSAPLISALYGLAGGSHGVSYPAQTLYQHLGDAGALFDVTQGGNGYCDDEPSAQCGEPEANEQLGKVDCLGTTACDAAPGFDGPSGVGAPIGLSGFGGPGLQTPPGVVTEKATETVGGAAVLNASVNPHGGEVTSCVFEWGAGTLSQSTPCSPSPGAGSEAVAVSAHISGLTPHTTYRFRIVATNAAGTGTGKTKKFKAR